MHSKHVKHLTCLVLVLLVIFTLNTQPASAVGHWETYVDVLCAKDEEFEAYSDETKQDWQSAITYAFDKFENTFGIVLRVVGWVSWDSDDDQAISYYLLEEAKRKTGFERGMSYGGYVVDILMAFTGQDMQGQGLSYPDWNALIVDRLWYLIDTEQPLTLWFWGTVICHELSHQFLCEHCGNWCMMNTYYWEQYRIIVYSWCDPCKTVIDANEDRFWRWIETGGGGGCPFVSVWDGTNYVLDNNVLPKSELNKGADVEDYYTLEQTLVLKNGKYVLVLSEFESECSYFDQAKLLAVDHSLDINIAFTPAGEILTYINPVAPVSITDNNGTSRLNEISLMDGNVSDPATYFQGYPGDYLILNFGQVNSENAKLIVRDDMKKVNECILVQVKDGNDAWQTVETLVPRAYWSVEAVNLAPYVVQGQDLWVRLYWKYRHRLDFVGLDTAPQDDYEIRYGNLVSATHSTQGDVKPLLLYSDSLYAELIPGQQIQLEFTLPNNSRPARTYVFCTKGHYYTIP